MITAPLLSKSIEVRFQLVGSAQVQYRPLEALDGTIDHAQDASVAGKVVDRHQAREPSPALNELYDVIGNAFGLSCVLNELNGGPPYRADRTPLAR
jgi:hypothetical protein